MEHDRVVRSREAIPAEEGVCDEWIGTCDEVATVKLFVREFENIGVRAPVLDEFDNAMVNK